MTMEAGNEYKKGLWTEEEDRILMDYITLHGEGKWNRVSQLTGLQRGGKSCRLRWINYLRPTVNRGGFSEEEDDLIIRLHKLLGNRWSLIAGRVPGRTDNQVKNHWNTHLSKKLGVKKEKNKVSASVRKLSRGLRKNFNTPLDSYPKQASGCNGGATNLKAIQEKEIEDGLKSVVEFTSTQEPVIVSDGFNNAVCFSNDEFNLYTPNLECLLDDYSLDFVLNDL